MADQRTLADIGEFEAISLIANAFGAGGGSGVAVGLGDDAAVLSVTSGSVVAALDQMVEGRHFRRDGASATEIGRKAVARSMSDLAAMGAVTTAVLVGLAAPGDTEVRWVVDLAAGIAQEAALAPAPVIGGDTVAGPVVVITVTALGDLEGREPVLRSGACVGDIVYLAGQVGRSAAGLAVLSRGHRSPRALVAAHRCPEPPYASGVAASNAGASAMIDISDGLLADLGHIARQSGVRIDLDTSALAPDSELDLMARNLGLDAWEWVLRGGEDHALAATFAPSAAVPPEFRRIGEVVAPSGAEEEVGGLPAVLVDGGNPGGLLGHEHFRS